MKSLLDRDFFLSFAKTTDAAGNGGDNKELYFKSNGLVFFNWNKYILFVEEGRLAMEMLNISLNPEHPQITKHYFLLLFFYLVEKLRFLIEYNIHSYTRCILWSVFQQQIAPFLQMMGKSYDF